MDPEQAMDPMQQMSPEMGGDFASPEQVDQLRAMLEAAKGKLGELNSLRFAQGNKHENERAEALRKVFEAMRAAGVNLDDPAAVNAFIAQIRERSPELAALFEQSLSELLGNEEENISPMNSDNEALQQEVRGPVPEEAGEITG